MAQSCPHCGYTPKVGETITIYKCGYCKQPCRHMGNGDCLAQDCTAEGRNGHHYNLEVLRKITGQKED